MAQNSKIEWTESTWNPVTGCTKISPGCKNCYAERIARRLHAMGQPNYRNGFRTTLQPHALEIPLHWKKPRTIFVNSMSDLFHKDVPLDFIQKVFDIMSRAPQHRFQVLTKRSHRLLQLSHKLPWPPNVWMGVSVENNDYTFRIDHLKQTPANIKFISLEPLIGPTPNLNLKNLDWIIVGGESGPKARPINPDWVLDIRDQCQQTNTPFFFKQWGGTNKKKTGRTLQKKTYNQMPITVPIGEAKHVQLETATR
ncbi:MAG: phage Gp37/Gp68 family protein [Planctomycetes bacterium]|nr:phage Gp37/Gp68 family protein [Planctomycetota bacterium]